MSAPMPQTDIRRLATKWWVRNLRSNPERAERWRNLANRNGGNL